jgi:hypothetical protein
MYVTFVSYYGQEHSEKFDHVLIEPNHIRLVREGEDPKDVSFCRVPYFLAPGDTSYRIGDPPKHYSWSCIDHIMPGSPYKSIYISAS